MKSFREGDFLVFPSLAAIPNASLIACNSQVKILAMSGWLVVAWSLTVLLKQRLFCKY